ncbi:leucyl aminopeptidase [Rhodovulum sulfidophilum]|uniref:leucyl aminopeptidase n=1 Tax=Rhodovulum sulfidophilum TaxID=35806 RepID=UPI000952AF5E|nr:leucyl aminopeptidase [Rhodovulum sulfidophilum]MBL3551723.1 leucyl aminopeptidase [Rhodovulum sulfidophilum]OLS48173.1 leucyl aminopeptidase [Rhodovulum sulfidophilum]
MSTPVAIAFAETDLDAVAGSEGRVAVLVDAEGKLDPGARRVNRLSRGALARVVESEAFSRMKPAEIVTLAWPAGLAAEAVDLVRLDRKASQEEARRAGAELAKRQGKADVTLLAGNHPRAADIAFGFALRAYSFDAHRSEEPVIPGAVKVMVTKPEEIASAAGPMAALAEGVFFTRDLVNEPANVLTTDDFAGRLAAMQELGLDVEILDEDELKALGMRALLAVGQGSESPSKVVVMRWNGGAADQAPLALVGKGVVFDTGGISIKPGQGMEEMTMDMGGAAVVAGVMRTLALRKSRANVVGVVGLVENMPDGRAQRPGDIVRSMKGDTIEVINTDAEGRLVLADVLWYAQDRFKPAGVIDLATLTGAIIVALGNANAGVFSNDDAFCADFLKAATREGEGAWRMPLGASYDKLIKSRLADIRNSAGRPAGSITAAQFLQRFIAEDTPWIHLDIAGVALAQEETALAPKGATGWGVLALDRLVADRFEK